jgi:hypothetical protein
MPIYFFTNDDDFRTDDVLRGPVTRPCRSLIAIIDPYRDVCQMRATWISGGRSVNVSATTRASVFDALHSMGPRVLAAVLWLPHIGGDIVLEHARAILGDVVPIVIVVPRLTSSRLMGSSLAASTILVTQLDATSLPQEVSGALDALSLSALAINAA